MEESTLHVYIADFGLTRILSEAGTACTHTSTKSSAGTPGFQSKEVLRVGHITTASDIYSLGCVFIELFGSKRVWPTLAPFQIMCQVVVDNKSPETDDLEQMQDICRKCTASDSSERPSAIEVLHYLFGLASPQTINKLILHAYSFNFQQ